MIGRLALSLGILGLIFLHLPGHHEVHEIDQGTPPAPPTVDPGPDAATLRIQIRDKQTGQLTSATVSVNRGDQEPSDDPYAAYSLRKRANRHKGPLRLRPLDYYFFSDGSFSVKVPPGAATLEIRKGYEYHPLLLSFDLEPSEIVESTVYLERWIDMVEEGFFSGDTHLHLERSGDNDDFLLTLTTARDIKYGFLLSMNTKGYDRGREFESWHQRKGMGDASVYRRGAYHLSSGQEYRTQMLGHVNILLADGYVPALGRSEDVTAAPSLHLIADQTHQLRGYIGLNHGGYDHQEADSLGLSRKTDFLELMQFGGYRGLGLQGWYDFLNLGFRWPIIAGSDFPYTRELGDCLTYASWPGGAASPPSVREWVQQLARGASFVTSGPLLFLRVNGRSPGDFLHFEGGRPATLEVELQVRSPLYPVRYLELIVDGRVAAQHFDPQGRGQWSLRERLTISRSGWIAARAYGDAGTDSHTNPVYYFLEGRHPFDPDACDQILARLEGSLRSITNPEIQARLKELKTRLQHYRDTQDPSALSLPPITAGPTP